MEKTMPFDMLPEDVDIAGALVSAMAKHRVWIIKFLEPATFEYT
jgi:hypothetical protein